MRTQKLALIVTLMNLALLAFLFARGHRVSAQEAATVLRGRALEIVDDRGKVRARIDIEPATTKDGKTYPESVVFRMTDPAGRIRVKLGADQDGCGLMLANDSQQPGVHLLAKAPGSFLKLVNKDGRERLLEP
jgi:hypothetical protein